MFLFEKQYFSKTLKNFYIMNEKEWVKSIKTDIEDQLKINNNNICIDIGRRLPYAYEIHSYKENKPEMLKPFSYETDLLVYEQLSEKEWKPRVIIEAKINISTHDAITYSQKAQTHKYVHPFLRYGILIGNKENKPLPGRLYRHGHHFDFMFSWKMFEEDNNQIKDFIKILEDEIEASLKLEEMLFDSRLSNRKKYTSLHRPLCLKEQK